MVRHSVPGTAQADNWVLVVAAVGMANVSRPLTAAKSSTWRLSAPLELDRSAWSLIGRIGRACASDAWRFRSTTWRLLDNGDRLNRRTMRRPLPLFEENVVSRAHPAKVRSILPKHGALVTNRFDSILGRRTL